MSRDECAAWVVSGALVACLGVVCGAADLVVFSLLFAVLLTCRCVGWFPIGGED